MQEIVTAWEALDQLLGAFAQADDPAAAVAAAFDDTLARLVDPLRRFEVVRLIEAARLAFLPVAPVGEMPVDPKASAAQLELLALIALAAHADAGAPPSGAEATVADQEIGQFLAEAGEGLDELLRLALLRSLAATDPADKLAMVSLLVRGSEVWMRNSSYPEMVKDTNRALFDEAPTVRAALNADLGFDATDALAVLAGCHQLQEAALNDRLDALGSTINQAMAAAAMSSGQLDDELTQRARQGFMALFEPDADSATVSVEDLVALTGVAEPRVRAVVERFRLDLSATTPEQVVDDFSAGKNPFRTRPLLVAGNGRVMLPHPALQVSAVRANLEEHLKTSAVWDQYAKHRGELLEARTHAALIRVLPGAHHRDAFEYYIPDNEEEATTADPAAYTKRVEGDHLVVVDDVAIIVEDKAVAFSEPSRGGKKIRIRRDLTRIVTDAADQASRMRDLIKQDGGLRIECEGWVDLSHVREIHTIAVSLDDIPAVLTATAELVRAGLLSADRIPWTVSVHDLDLITQLVDRPAEFLLYLRRRNNPDVTVMFSAPDELDLFLYFFEQGLWVEPDPARLRAAFPFLPPAGTSELRRHRTQGTVLLTSRTDPLDRWYHATLDPSGVHPPTPKPAMVPSPLGPLVDDLQARGTTGWLSIGAELLSMDTRTQRTFARHPGKLLDNPDPQGRGRSLTAPITASADPAEGWLLVWATRPPTEDPADAEQRLRDYLRAKKHQLGLHRGACFLYDETTRDLIGIYYDGHTGPLSPALAARQDSLLPASNLVRTVHPAAGRTPHGAQPSPRSSRARTGKRKR